MVTRAPNYISMSWGKLSMWPASFACSVMLMGSMVARAEVSVPARAPMWPDTFVSRLEAQALLETFNAELLTHDSATLTLEHWCDIHRMASPPRVVAERVSLDKPPSPDQRRELGIGPTESVRYRRVRLRCGSLVLSEADNWYVPSRLTKEMNELLDTSDTPFGKVVQGLHFQRRTLSSKLLWLPLPDGWEMRPIAGAGPGGAGLPGLSIPPMLLEHRALLTLADGTPFSEVVETYTNHILDFPAPLPGGSP
jgi:chorismate-pyruvate lyase